VDGAEVTVESVSDTLLTVLARHLRRVPDDVDWATVTLADLGLDSMVAIELVLDIEDTYGAEFPQDLLVRETFASFHALEAVVKSMVARP
jgi:acyl carrier protein